MTLIEIKLTCPSYGPVYVQCHDKDEANKKIEEIENNLMGGGFVKLKLTDGTVMLLAYHGYEYIRVTEG